MHDSLEEALRVLDDLRARVDSNARRPSADQVLLLTQVMALIGEWRSAQVIHAAAKVPVAPAVHTNAPFQLGAPIIATHPRLAARAPAASPASPASPAATPVDAPIPANLPPDEPVLSSAGVLRSDDRGPADVPTIEEGTAAGSGDARGGRPPDADPSR